MLSSRCRSEIADSAVRPRRCRSPSTAAIGASRRGASCIEKPGALVRNASIQRASGLSRVIRRRLKKIPNSENRQDDAVEPGIVLERRPDDLMQRCDHDPDEDEKRDRAINEARWYHRRFRRVTIENMARVYRAPR